MTEAEWLACTDPDPLLRFLRYRATERKLRLYACASCRQVSHLLDEQDLRALEVAEHYADGLESLDELERTLLAESRGRRGGVRRAVRHSLDRDGIAFTDAGWRFVWDHEAREQSRLLRDLVGNLSALSHSIPPGELLS